MSRVMNEDCDAEYENFYRRQHRVVGDQKIGCFPQSSKVPFVV